MSKEASPNRRVQPARVRRRHPQEQEVIDLLQGYIREGKMPPSYPTIAESLGMKSHMTVYEIVKRAGLQDALKELRKREKNMFTPSKETAWFLGVVFASRGSVDPTRNQIVFYAKDADLARAFKSTGELLFSNDRVTKHAKHIDGSPTDLAFFDKDAIQALGDFSPKKKVETLLKRHGWVTLDIYLKSFLSGIVDSGARFSLKKRAIDFAAGDISVAEFLIDQFRRIDVDATLSTELEKDNLLYIRKLDSVRMLCSQVASESSDISKKLDSLKNISRKERRSAQPESIAQIVAEWERLRGLNRGRSMSSNQINDLYHQGETLFSVNTYLTYLGESDDGPNKFSAAKRRLDKIAELDADEKRIVFAMKLDVKTKMSERKTTDEELLAELEKLSSESDTPLTTTLIRKKYALGETPYNVQMYIRYLGAEEGKTPSFTRAMEYFEQTIQSRRTLESSEKTIYSQDADNAK